MKGETEKKKIRHPSTRELERFWGEVFVEEFLCGNRTSTRTWKLLKRFAERMPKEALHKLIHKPFQVMEVESARVEDIGCPLGLTCPYGEKKPLRKLVLLDHHYLSEFSEKAVIGVLAHEFAHVALDQPFLPPEEAERNEKEADELATKWGFAEEIKLLQKEARVLSGERR